MTGGPGGGARNFVLVHGAWHGGWCWARVRDILTARGHRVFTPTLTGLADRSHLMSRDITLDTHIQDVANLILWEGLGDVILCGHSYAGWVISGAVERVADRVAALVYLDAYVPEDGECGRDVISERGKASIDAALKAGEPSRPAPPARHFRVNEADQDWVDGLLTPHPVGVALGPIRLSGARERIAHKTYIRTPAYPSARFDADAAKVRARPGWDFIELACGHDVMVDMPDRLADILEQVA
ncbi:MAG: alpha/beta fold hydrolase [Alphaproteobacteria bacterium]|nr:alpha/beta fold hydrolase [Alphaproteobacteria bacterium]